MERVDEAIAAAERTLGAPVEFAGDAARSEARPVRGGCGMGAPVTGGALTEAPVEAIATSHGASAVSRRIADPGGVVPADSRKAVFEGRSGRGACWLRSDRRYPMTECPSVEGADRLLRRL